MWLRTLLLFVLIALALRALRRFLGGVAQGVTDDNAGRAPRAQQTTPVKMVADPVCGTFVVPGKALQLARGRDTFYFCSDKCRNQWQGSHAQ
jgi:YHS domain-containing protein